MLGSTGNLYEIKLDKQPTCTCPDYMNGNLCKHILFIFIKVLRCFPDDYRIWQKKLHADDHLDLMDLAALRVGNVSKDVQADKEIVVAVMSPTTTVKRKSMKGASCPICFEDFHDGMAENCPSVVWCKAQCGQNIHKQCMDMWKLQKGRAGQTITCTVCRSPWNMSTTQKSSSIPGVTMQTYTPYNYFSQSVQYANFSALQEKSMK